VGVGPSLTHETIENWPMYAKNRRLCWYSSMQISQSSWHYDTSILGWCRKHSFYKYLAEYCACVGKTSSMIWTQRSDNNHVINDDMHLVTHWYAKKLLKTYTAVKFLPKSQRLTTLVLISDSSAHSQDISHTIPWTRPGILGGVPAYLPAFTDSKLPVYKISYLVT